MLVLYCSVKFPFRAQHWFANKRRASYTHLIFVLTGFIVPLLPVLIIVAEAIVDYQENNATSANLVSSGLGFDRGYSPTVCLPTTNFRLVLYSFSLLLIMIIGAGASLMILTFFHLCKVGSVSPHGVK